MQQLHMAQSCKRVLSWAGGILGVILLASCGGEAEPEVPEQSGMPQKLPANWEGEGAGIPEEPAVENTDAEPAETETVELPKLENIPTTEMAANMSGAELFATVCAACHGAKGEGKAELKTPSIAGMPAWYSKIQIEKFQKDFRGTDVADPTGMQMHAVAMILDIATAEKVSEEIAKLDLIATTSTLGKGDAESGAVLYRERCMECHRFNGRGEIAFRSSPLIGFQDWYIVDQMKKYQAGMRGGKEGDIDGAKMHQISEYMNEEQMYDIAAHIVELAEKYADWVPRRERRAQEASGQ